MFFRGDLPTSLTSDVGEDDTLKPWNQPRDQCEHESSGSMRTCTQRVKIKPNQQREQLTSSGNIKANNQSELETLKPVRLVRLLRL
jgi:hypothetical protein